jgi:hypothetical protein
VSDTFHLRDLGDRADWLFYCILGSLPSDHPVRLSMKPGSPVTVDLTINGVAVPFRAAVERMLTEYTRQVGVRAAELCEERASESLARFDELASRLCRVVTSERKRLFPEVELSSDRD